MREFGAPACDGSGLKSGTFEDARAHLSSYRSVGIDTILILPVHPLGEARWGPVGCPYEPMDYHAIEPSLVRPEWGAGTERLAADYNAFIASAPATMTRSFEKFAANRYLRQYAEYNSLRLLSGVGPGGQLSVGAMSRSRARLEVETIYEQFVAFETFRAFVSHAHTEGLRVLQDIPGYLGAGCCVERLRPDLLLTTADGQYYVPGTNQWGHGWYSLRQLDPESENAMTYACAAFHYWHTAAGVDGFRLDAVLTQPESYLRRIRAAVPGAFLLGETIGEYRGDMETTFLDELSLDAIYEQEWIGTVRPEQVIMAAHERRSSVGKLWMRNTHDEGRFRVTDRFAVPPQRLIGLFALAALALPEGSSLGLMEGDLELRPGKPDLNGIAERRQSPCSQGPSVSLSDGTAPTTYEYMRRILSLAHCLPELRVPGRLRCHNADGSDVKVFSSAGEGREVLLAVNLGANTFRGTVVWAPEHLSLSGPRTLMARELVAGKAVMLAMGSVVSAELSLCPGQVCAFTVPLVDRAARAVAGSEGVRACRR